MSGLWPCRPKAFPDESMFSWLGRVANAHAISLRELKSILPFSRCKSAYEYDKVVTPEQLEFLSEHTGVAVSDLIRLTFYNAEGIIMPQVQQVRNKWILRQKKQAVTPICIDCLNEISPFYYRLHWRYAFITHCEKHGTILIDKCESCGEFINIYKYILNTKEIDQYEMQCANCGHLLYRSQKINSLFSPVFQETYKEVMSSHTVELRGKKISSIVFFELAHLLASIISGSRARFDILQTVIDVCKSIDVDYECFEKLLSNKLDIEKRSVLERCQISNIIQKIISSVELTVLLHIVACFHFSSCWQSSLPCFVDEIKAQLHNQSCY